MLMAGKRKRLTLEHKSGNDDFSASNCWLEAWQKLFSERLATLCDEVAEVPRDVVVDCTKCLPTITDGYGLADIYNAHEMGLYFRALPSRSMVVCNDYRKGIQMYKEGKGVSEMCGISMNVYVMNELCIIIFVTVNKYIKFMLVFSVVSFSYINICNMFYP